MLVLASDYEDQLLGNYEITEKAMREAYAKCSRGESNTVSPDELRFVVEPYNTPKFWELLKEADGLICAFIPVDESFLAKAPSLKMISVNATGYNALAMDALKSHHVSMSHIVSYCTREVAEHAIAMMLALNKNFPQYGYAIHKEKKWKYMDLVPGRTVDHLTLTIFGLGRIGQMSATLANALGMKVQAVDPYLPKEIAEKCHVALVDKKEAMDTSDVIINHMVLNDVTKCYFDQEFFDGLKKHPIFINVGRGGSVDEGALQRALEHGEVRAAGLDVLMEEDPDLNRCPFVQMENVILTPHSAFYSEDSNRALEEISGSSMGQFLAGYTKDIQGYIAWDCETGDGK